MYLCYAAVGAYAGFNVLCVSVLQQWELLVVAGLEWDLASVLPSDFLEQILHGIPIIPHNLHALRRHVHSYIALAATGRGRHWVTHGDVWLAFSNAETFRPTSQVS